MVHRCLAIALIFWPALLSAGAAFGAEPTAVALTLTKSDTQGPEQKLSEDLLKLLQERVEADHSLKLIEHRQVDVAAARRLLDRSNAEGLKKIFGKLLSANYLLMLETVPADKEGQPPSVRLRVVDAGSSAVRGVLAARLERDTLGRTADEFLASAHSMISAPEQARVTVAVVPFDSQGNFDRLRPMELKIRDLIAARLIELGGGRAPRFQVLQRSNLAELIHERDAARSGLADKSDSPVAPAATYLVRGQIDERLAEDLHALLVKGEMVDLSTKRPVETFQFECGEKDLEKQLSSHVDKLAARLSRQDQPPAGTTAISDLEAESLKAAALADLAKMVRRNHANQLIRFRVDRKTDDYGGRDMISTDSELGRSMLLKSIERLESVLLHHPDDAVAACALGFCYASHQPGVYQPKRSDELFRQVYELDPRSELASLALLFLAEISYDDRNGRPHFEPGGEREACERLLFTFEHLSEKNGGSGYWPDLLERTAGLLRSPDQLEQLSYLMQQALGRLDHCRPELRPRLASSIAEIAERLASLKRNPDLQATGEKLLRRWTGGEDLMLVQAAARMLGRLLAEQKHPLEAAEVLKESSQKLSSLDSDEGAATRARLLLSAANYYRAADEPKKALALLQSDQLQSLVESKRLDPNIRGSRDFEIGLCYEDLQQPKQALEAFLRAMDNYEYAELAEHIIAVGGIPLDPARDVEVHYYPPPREKKSVHSLFQSHLATGGKKIFVGSQSGLMVFNPKGRAWKETLRSEPIHCLKYTDGQLWVGTEAAGLWRFDIAQDKWTEVAKSKLPDPHVESLLIIGNDVFAGCGKPPSGGLVHIDDYERVTAFSQPDAPKMAPTYLVSSGEGLLARTDKAVYHFDLRSSWSKAETPGEAPRLFAGEDCVWASTYFQELTRWGNSSVENQQFAPAWGVRRPQGGGWRDVAFIAQHGDQIWFGGFPSSPIKASGICRFDLKTHEFHEFTPADGFKTWFRHTVYDGLWLDDRLWLATAEGLCAVTKRSPGKEAPDADSPDEPVAKPRKSKSKSKSKSKGKGKK